MGCLLVGRRPALQPFSESAKGPRLALERGVTGRFSPVLGSRLTLRNPAYAGRSPAFSELDRGVRYYAGGQTFRGPFAGLYAGYDLVRFRRLIIAPALGASMVAARREKRRATPFLWVRPQCERRDSNPDRLPYQLLRLARLPVPPRSRAMMPAQDNTACPDTHPVVGCVLDRGAPCSVPTGSLQNVDISGVVP